MSADTYRARARRHLLIGWATLLGFLLLGMVLEMFHAFKVGWYLDVGNESRRLMWTLAHTHGTLLGLIHLGLASTIRRCPDFPLRWWVIGSRCLSAATLLMPLGFFIGGIVTYGGDPGLGVLIVPAGSVFLLAAVTIALVAAWRSVEPEVGEDAQLDPEEKQVEQAKDG